MRPPLVSLVAFVAGALGGIVASTAVGEARADIREELVVPVPAQGVAFRGSTGQTIVRIRSSPVWGGTLEVFDAHENLAVRLRATSSGGVFEIGRSPPAVASTIVSSADPGY